MKELNHLKKQQQQLKISYSKRKKSTWQNNIADELRNEQKARKERPSNKMRKALQRKMHPVTYTKTKTKNNYKYIK